MQPPQHEGLYYDNTSMTRGAHIIGIHATGNKFFHSFPGHLMNGQAAFCKSYLVGQNMLKRLKTAYYVFHGCYVMSMQSFVPTWYYRHSDSDTDTVTGSVLKVLIDATGASEALSRPGSDAAGV
jgi:hypothetical protein